MRQNRALKVLELAAWLQPELVDHRLTDASVALEGIGLPTAPIKREHKLTLESFSVGMLPAEHVELTDQLGVAAEREIGVDPALERGEPSLLEPPDLACAKDS
jgi:hypothetical protein